MGKAKKLIFILLALGKARICKIKTPLVIGWAITNRCNRSCSYCAIWQRRTEELSREQVFQVVDALQQMGTLMISFTGGEPLLREDIGEIIDYIHKKGIEVKINSNATLVKEKIRDLMNLDILNLSLEGPEEIHDTIRGLGSYQEVMGAAKIAQENGIKVNFVTVLTKINLEHIDFILDKARGFKSKVIFQPATQLILGARIPNPIVPSEEACREAIKTLIHKKKEGNRYIGNSLSVLRHLYHWPDKKRVRCVSGWISCRIEPNGDVIYCSREKQPFVPFNCLRDGFSQAFKSLKPISCDDCWCAARLELNQAFYFDAYTIFNQFQALIA